MMQAKEGVLVLAALALAGGCGRSDDVDASGRPRAPTSAASARASSRVSLPSSAAAPSSAAVAPGGPVLGGIQQIALGMRMDCGRKDDGSVWCWQSGGSAKRLGMDAVKQIAVVDGFVCAISPKGQIACTEAQTGRVIPISLYRDGVVLVGGPSGYCVRTEDGVLRCGVQDPETRDVKAPSGLPGLKDPSAFSIGATVGCGVLDAELWCWNNEKGAGLPRTMKDLKGAATVAVGRLRGCASTTSGEIFCFRAQRDAEPRKLEGWQDVTQVAMAYGATEPDRLCGLKRDGSVACGSLGGEGDAAEIGAPTPIDGVSDATELGSGAASHSCARTKAGTVWCWGLAESRASMIREQPPG
jgi:hypothetical protein